MSVREYMQSFYKAAGNYSCYALTIINLAKKIIKSKGANQAFINEQEALIFGIEQGFIHFDEKNYDDYDNFTVYKPAEFLSFLTGDKFSVRFESAKYKCQKDEYEILFWALNDGYCQKGIGHFTLPGENTLQFSKTVEKGKVYSKRIFKKIS